MSGQTDYKHSWPLECYSKLSSNDENSINSQTRVIFLNHAFNVLTNGSDEIIYITPDTYVLYSTRHLGILSFDPCHYGKWVLSFHDENSAKHCVSTLRNSGINVTDIQKLLNTRIEELESAVIKTIKNAEFPHFVAKVENAMKNKSDE